MSSGIPSRVGLDHDPAGAVLELNRLAGHGMNHRALGLREPAGLIAGREAGDRLQAHAR